MTRSLLVALAAFGVLELMPAKAQAGFSAYYFNVTKPGEGWKRWTHRDGMNQSYRMCLSQISSAASYSHMHKDIFAYGINLGSKLKIGKPSNIVYVPRGHMVSLDLPGNPRDEPTRAVASASIPALPSRRVRDEAA